MNDKRAGVAVASVTLIILKASTLFFNKMRCINHILIFVCAKCIVIDVTCLSSGKDRIYSGGATLVETILDFVWL